MKDKAQEMLNGVWSYLELQVVGNCEKELTLQ